MFIWNGQYIELKIFNLNTIIIYIIESSLLDWSKRNFRRLPYMYMYHWILFPLL